MEELELSYKSETGLSPFFELHVDDGLEDSLIEKIWEVEIQAGKKVPNTMSNGVMKIYTVDYLNWLKKKAEK